MNRIIDRLKLVFLVIFGVAALGTFVYHYGWVWPRQRCEADHKWWDPKGRVCAQPVLISDITGRTIEDKQAEAQARANLNLPAKVAAPPRPAPATPAPAAPPAAQKP